MTGLKERLLNILLFPSRLYARLSDDRLTLYAGIILIGAVDLFVPDIAATYKLLFTGLPTGSVRLNIMIAVAVVALLGTVDTVFFSVPLYDVCKYLKKKEDKPHGASPVKVMKVYIVSHFLIIPVNVLMHYALFRNLNENSGALMQNLFIVYFFLILIWSSGIVTRGVNSLFDFNPLFRRLTFIIIFTWNFVFSMAFELKIMNWLLMLFKYA